MRDVLEKEKTTGTIHEANQPTAVNNLLELYRSVRQHSIQVCKPLKTEDYVVQPVVDVSPPKWHLGHTTWFFETFLLKPHLPGYREFDPMFNFVFNSYYESVGARVVRTNRGNLSRPAVDEVYAYRRYVDAEMEKLLSRESNKEIEILVTLGCNHEQQHQELLFSDIKYILGHNPLLPAYNQQGIEEVAETTREEWIGVEEGVYEIGFEGEGFCFDNEMSRHKVYLQPFEISNRLVTNEEFLQFITEGGYTNFRFWHAEGWDWVKTNQATAPLYWHFINGEWYQYTLGGLQKIKLQQPATHVNYFEAAAFAASKGARLPTEAEWEVAARSLNWGQRWEWTESAYLPYPGFEKAEGAIGEYNGKFMVNQMVLRGASVATPKGHSRITYRNFFQTHLQWQFTGIRLAR